MTQRAITVTVSAALRRWFLLGLFAVPLLGSGFGITRAAADDLRVRLGANARGEMLVLGLDPAGIRLRPVEGNAGGEIIMPLAEARDLLFVLPEPYQRAQQLAFNGRPAEAVLLLKPVVLPLVPYLGAPGTNAVAAVNFYFDLLMGQAEWDEALALAKQLPLDAPDTGFLPKVVRLARALRSTERPIDATALIGRIPINTATMPWFSLLADFADELRRNGNFVEARAIYERLRPFDVGEAQVQRTLLIAYTEYHTGAPMSAAALFELVAEPVENSELLPLYLMLKARLELDHDEVAPALDHVGRGLVVAAGASEWRAELQAVAAAAYRAAGRDDVAETIEADMRRIFPDSRWTPASHSPAS